MEDDGAAAGIGPGEEAGGGESDDGSGARGAKVSGALLRARAQEQARVTLLRALQSAVLLAQARGFDVTHVSGVPVADAPQCKALLDQYGEPSRASLAEDCHEVAIIAEVPKTPRMFTPAWAYELPEGSKLAVVVASVANVDTVRRTGEVSKHLGFHTTILLTRDQLTPSAKKSLADASLCHFRYEDLQASIASHVLVPMHRVLNAALTARVRAEFGSPPDAKLCRLLLSDPMVGFLGLSCGTVVACVEKFGNQQASTTFFEVIDQHGSGKISEK